MRRVRRGFSVRNLALSVVCAASYAALVIFLAPISFLQMQVRVANTLMGLVPILGMPAVYGLTLGVFLGNIVSPLGPIDLISPLPSFIGLFAIYKLRNKSVLLGLLIYSFIISLWVAFMLNLVIGVPYWITLAYVFLGVAIATVGLGYLLYKAVSKVGLVKAIKRD
jgi:uncharacterized membrane protein